MPVVWYSVVPLCCIFWGLLCVWHVSIIYYSCCNLAVSYGVGCSLLHSLNPYYNFYDIYYQLWLVDYGVSVSCEISGFSHLFVCLVAVSVICLLYVGCSSDSASKVLSCIPQTLLADAVCFHTMVKPFLKFIFVDVWKSVALFSLSPVAVCSSVVPCGDRRKLATKTQQQRNSVFSLFLDNYL